MALCLSVLLGLHVADLHRRGMRLSSTPFVDPAGVMQVTAWDFYTVRRLHDGEFPLWNPLTGIGQPHLANLQTAVFYPLKAPFYITGGLGGHDLYLFLRLLLLGLGPFVLLRALGVGRAGSVFGGVAFGCGGYALWFANLVELNNQALTPFLMIALTRLGMGYTPRRFMAAAGLIVLNVLGGHPEGIFVTGLFSGLFAVFWVGGTGTSQRGTGMSRLPGAFGRWVAAVVVGVIGSAAVLIPFIEYFPRAWNFHFSGMGFLHFGPRALFQFLSAYFSPLSGGPMLGLPDGVLDMRLWDYFRLPYKDFMVHAGLPYVGLIVASFMLSAAIRFGKLPRGGGFFIAFFLGAVSFSMGLFPFKLLSFLPPFHVTNNAKFYFAEITLCACLLGGMGVDRLSRSSSRCWLYAAVLAVLMAFAAILANINYPDLRGVYLQLIPAGLLFISFILPITYLRGVAAVAMLIFELAIMQPTVGPYLPLNWGKAQTAGWPEAMYGDALPAVRFQARENFLFPPNLNLVRSVADIRSSDAMFPRDYFDWINRLGGLEGEAVLHDFYPRYYSRLNDKALASRDAAIMGLRYLASEKPIPDPGPYKFLEKKDAFIYEREDVCPEVFYWISDRRSCDPDRIDLAVDEEFWAVSSPSKQETLVINQLRYPGWRAFTYTEELTPVDIGIPLQAYDTGGGNDLVMVYFRPSSFLIGLWTSLVTMIFGLVWFVKRESKH